LQLVNFFGAQPILGEAAYSSENGKVRLGSNPENREARTTESLVYLVLGIGFVCPFLGKKVTNTLVTKKLIFRNKKEKKS
jgi:hypothetical protein